MTLLLSSVMMLVRIVFFLDGWMLVRIVVTPGRQNPQCRSCFELPDERYFVVKHIFANSILSMK